MCSRDDGLNNFNRDTDTPELRENLDLPTCKNLVSLIFWCVKAPKNRLDEPLVVPSSHLMKMVFKQMTKRRSADIVKYHARRKRIKFFRGESAMAIQLVKMQYAKGV